MVYLKKLNSWTDLQISRDSGAKSLLISKKPPLSQNVSLNYLRMALLPSCLVPLLGIGSFSVFVWTILTRPGHLSQKCSALSRTDPEHTINSKFYYAITACIT